MIKLISVLGGLFVQILAMALTAATLGIIDVTDLFD